MIFDGPGRLIILEASDGNAVATDDIYSRWKDWVQGDVGAQYPAAFSTIGGEALGGGVFAGSYFFLNTADGWVIRPREAAHDLTISGNLFPLVAGATLFASTLGNFRVQIRLLTSSLTQAISTAGSSPTDVANAVWANATGTQVAASVELVRKISGNRLEVNLSTQRLNLYDDDGTTLLRWWELSTNGGEAVGTVAGVQTKRGAPVTPP